MTEPVDVKGTLRRLFHPSGLLAGDEFPQVPTIALAMKGLTIWAELLFGEWTTWPPGVQWAWQYGPNAMLTAALAQATGAATMLKGLPLPKITVEPPRPSGKTAADALEGEKEETEE